MAIVIKGEMPKGRCWWHDEQGKEHECQFFPCTGDADNCPIIGEIPDKHGRLIDADELMKKVRQEADFPSYEWCKAIECLEDAPTVLEASDDCDCTAPDCLDCKRNDECNHIGLFETDE